MTVDTVVTSRIGTKLPAGWRVVRFGDVVRDVKIIVDPEESDLERYIAGEHMETDNLHIRSWGTIGDGYLGPAFHRKFVAGQVLYGSRRTYLRKVAVADFDGICSNTTFVLEPANGDMIPRLLPFIMQTESFVRHSMQQSRGSTNPYVTFKDLAWYEFALPPRDEQRRIAEILWATEDTIQQLRVTNEQIAISRSVVMVQFLTQGVDLDNMDPEDSPTDILPENWRWGRLGELCFLSGGNGFRPPDWSSQGLPIIRIQNLNGSTDFNYFAGKPEPKWIVEPGELLYAWAGVKGVSFGPCIWPGPRGVLNQHIYRVKPRPEIDKVWLYELLRVITHNIEKKAHGFKHELLHVRQADVVGQIVPIPPLSQQEWIANLSAEFSKLQSAHQQHLRHSDELKKRLLNSLLRGEN